MSWPEFFTQWGLVLGGWLWGHWVASNWWKPRLKRSLKQTGKALEQRDYFISQFQVVSGGQGMTRAEVRDVIRLSRVTSRGTVAHEEEAIREVLSR